MVFDILFSDGNAFENDTQQLALLEQLRFRVIPHKALADLKDVQMEINPLGEERDHYP